MAFGAQATKKKVKVELKKNRNTYWKQLPSRMTVLVNRDLNLCRVRNSVGFHILFSLIVRVGIFPRYSPFYLKVNLLGVKAINF